MWANTFLTQRTKNVNYHDGRDLIHLHLLKPLKLVNLVGVNKYALNFAWPIMAPKRRHAVHANIQRKDNRNKYLLVDAST